MDSSKSTQSSDAMLPNTVRYTRNNTQEDTNSFAFMLQPASGSDDAPSTPLEEILPVHNRSVLLTSTRPYESVVTTLKEGFPMVKDPSSTVQNNSLAQIPVDEKEKGTAEKLKSYFEGGSAIPQDTVNDPINNYTLFISPERQRDNSPFNEGEDGCEKSQSISSKSRLPYGGDSGICSKSFGAAGVMQNNWKKIASPLPSATNSRQMSTSPTTFPSPPRENDALLGKDASNAADDFIYMTDHLVPHWAPCYSRNNLEDDSVSLMAFWQSLKSETVSKSILYSFRTTLFAVVPTYILTAHPSTAHWFVGKALVPVIAALFVKPNLGFQIIMIVLTIQVCLAVMTWGIIMNAVGAVHNTSGWWCGVVFAPFIVSLFGDVPSKRLIMMYVIIIMQLEHSPGGETFIFPVKFARDVAIASAFALIANVLPYPVFAQKQAKEAMAGLHKLYAAAIGNAMKSYWAPVNIDARAARGQIPFERMREVTGIVRTLIHFISYEPTEFDLTNILRQERLAALGRIKSHLHAMTAVASQRIAAGQNFSTPQYVKEFEKRMQHPCMELAKAIIDVLPVLGTHLKPADVAAKVPYVEIANKTIMLQDVIEREQLQMLFITRAIGEETISYLRTFSFAHSLLNIAAEIQQIETAMKNFDPSKYPSMWSRAFDFFFYDNWKDFWTELPKRLTLATPRDVRIVKDSIKYALAFAVACAFTLHYDEENVYYFGMAILIRLAQQTASETLIIGVYRICGLCIGCALSYITATKTHTFTQTTLLTMTFSFISLCFGLHPVYSFGAQYVFVVSITGIALAHQPSLLLTRTTDNVFAFISFFVICAFLFPFDPIRVLWNVRTKILMNINDATQTFVALGCAPITKDGDEGQFFMPQLKQIIGQQQLLLKEYGEWMVKCVTEPTIRGGEYPSPQDSILYHALWELCSLQEAMLSAMARLHRPRTAAPSIIVRDVMELTHPFLQDAGRLVQSYCQSLINATETPLEWSLEEAIHILWKGELACRSLNRITANIQKNFFAAVHQLSTCEKKKVNVYLPADVIEEAFRAENDASLNPPAEDDELMQRLYAMSFHMSSNTVFPSEDMHAFNSIVNMFELMLHTMAELLPPMVKIHAFEKSRVI